MSWSKESQERWKSAATVFSLVAVPVVLTWGGWQIQRQLAKESIQQQYVELALEILRQPASDANPDEKTLREWSVELVNLYAPKKLTDKGERALVRQGVSIYDSPRSPFSILNTPCQDAVAAGRDPTQDEKCLRYLLMATQVRKITEEAARDNPTPK